MTETSLSWDYYRSFLQVVETGSLSAAAANLGLTQPTLGRHISALEKAIGVTLFVRSQNGFAPTEEALRLIPFSRSIEANAAAFLREATAREGVMAGTVRISASEIVGSEVLPPILAKLHQAHPGLSIELILSNAAEDLSSREADIAVRMFPPTQKALISKKVGEAEIGLHAHKSYLKRRGTPATWAELAKHSLICFDKENEYLRKYMKLMPSLNRGSFQFRSDSDIAQVAAIRAGFGIGFCQTILVKNQKDIVRVMPSEVNFTFGAWVVMPEDLRNSPRCKIVFNALCDGLGAILKRR
ncbi:MAG: LysR family transcriptional regulator [Proteobacteria bacterium]|nr:MAG: LysR family transcriptional regulator [Pseudomonadota bacterium]